MRLVRQFEQPLLGLPQNTMMSNPNVVKINVLRVTNHSKGGI
jgi:hypothetical protein